MKTINFVFLFITSLMCMAGTKAFAHDIEASNDDGVSIYLCMDK